MHPTQTNGAEARATDPSATAWLAPRRYSGSLLAFLLITFAVTWSCFLPEAMGLVRYPTLLGRTLVFLGTIAPSLVALALTARAAGRGGVRGLLDRIFAYGVAPKWYGFAVGYFLAIQLIAALIQRAVTGSWPPFGQLPLVLIPLAIAVSTPVQVGEELGWRGYALPRLASHIGFASASVWLGVIWALWHLPLFLVPEVDTYRQSFIVFAVQVTAISVAMTWLYVHVRGTLLPVMLMHAAINNTAGIVSSTTTGPTSVFGLRASFISWIGAALLWVCAAYFLVSLARARGLRPTSE